MHRVRRVAVGAEGGAGEAITALARLGTTTCDGFGAPAATLLLAIIVVVSLFGLNGTPQLIERNLLRPHGLLASSLTTWAIHRRNPNYSSLGASGPIVAVVLAAIVVDPGSSLYILPIPYPIPAPLFAIGYLAYSVLAGRSSIGRINHDAHAAGAVAGLLFMAVAVPGSIGRAIASWLG